MKKHLCLLAAFLLMALPSVPAVRAETPSAVSFARAEYWIAQKAVKEISILVEPEDAEDSYNVTVSDPAVLEAAHYYDERFKLKGLKPGDSAFSSCKKLANLPDLAKLQTVGAKAFRDCAALKSFTVGSKVKQIGKEAFSRCNSLKSLTILTKKLNAKNVGKKAFEGLNAKVKVRCPKGKAKAYEKLLKACGLPATATVE